MRWARAPPPPRSVVVARARGRDVAEHAVGRRVAEPRRLVRARVVARVLEDRLKRLERRLLLLRERILERLQPLIDL